MVSGLQAIHQQNIMIRYDKFRFLRMAVLPKRLNKQPLDQTSGETAMGEYCSATEGRIAQIDEGIIKGHLNEMVRSTVEETLNQMLGAEAQQLCNAERYERTEQRCDSPAGHYTRGLHTTQRVK